METVFHFLLPGFNRHDEACLKRLATTAAILLRMENEMEQSNTRTQLSATTFVDVFFTSTTLSSGRRMEHRFRGLVASSKLMNMELRVVGTLH